MRVSTTLRPLLADAVSRRRARNDRLVADVEDVLDGLAPYVAVDEPRGVAPDDRSVLVEALSSAAGVPVIGRAVEESWRLRAAGSAGLAADPVGAPAPARPAAPAAPAVEGPP